MFRFIRKKPFHLFVVGFLFIFTCRANADFVMQNDGIIGQRAVSKIELMGKELFEKTGISVYLIAIDTLKNKNIVTFENEISKELIAPFVLLTLAKKEQKVDIISSDDVKGRFDKEQILSPYPWKGTIIPLLSVKKNEDKYSASMLNGYADIVEQIASNEKLKLDTQIGSTNKTTIGYLRALFYGIIAFVLSVLIYRRIKRNARK